MKQGIVIVLMLGLLGEQSTVAMANYSNYIRQIGQQAALRVAAARSAASKAGKQVLNSVPFPTDPQNSLLFRSYSSQPSISSAANATPSASWFKSKFSSSLWGTKGATPNIQPSSSSGLISPNLRTLSTSVPTQWGKGSWKEWFASKMPMWSDRKSNEIVDMVKTYVHEGHYFNPEELNQKIRFAVENASQGPDMFEHTLDKVANQIDNNEVLQTAVIKNQIDSLILPYKLKTEPSHQWLNNVLRKINMGGSDPRFDSYRVFSRPTERKIAEAVRAYIRSDISNRDRVKFALHNGTPTDSALIVYDIPRYGSYLKALGEVVKQVTHPSFRTRFEQSPTATFVTTKYGGMQLHPEEIEIIQKAHDNPEDNDDAINKATSIILKGIGIDENKIQNFLDNK